MSEALTAGLRPWNCALSTAQVAGVLECAIRWGAHEVALRDTDGSVQVHIGPDAEHGDVGAGHLRAYSEIATTQAPVVVREVLVGEVEVSGWAEERALLETIVQTCATRLAEAWQVAHEIDNLASEIVHAYEELHLLYDLG